MKTYKQHYEECRVAFGPSTVSVYDLTAVSDFLNFDMDNFNKMSHKINECFEASSGCYDDNWATRLNEWKHIEEIENFCQEVVPQIERSVFGCYLKIEFIHPYKNRAGVTDESSWTWHYDDCPKEFIKMAIYLNDVNENNGCLQILSSPDNSIPVVDTYRLDPSAVKGVPPPVFPKTRIPKNVLGRIKENGGKFINLTGSSGSHFVFTPNIIHRATIPLAGENPRQAIFMFLRPSLQKHENHTKNAHSFLPERNVKKYELD
jgi:hypothetical protein